MISILAQERLLGIALGSIFVGAVVFEQRRGIYSLISENKSSEKARYEPKEDIFGKRFAHLWNKAVDDTLGPVIASLSSHRW